MEQTVAPTTRGLRQTRHRKSPDPGWASTCAGMGPSEAAEPSETGGSSRSGSAVRNGPGPGELAETRAPSDATGRGAGSSVPGGVGPFNRGPGGGGLGDMARSGPAGGGDEVEGGADGSVAPGPTARA